MTQVSHLNFICSELRPLIYIWNALKESRKVLGVDMPLASEAQQWETRAKQTIDTGLKAAEALQTKGDYTLESGLLAVTREIVSNCE